MHLKTYIAVLDKYENDIIRRATEINQIIVNQKKNRLISVFFEVQI